MHNVVEAAWLLAPQLFSTNSVAPAMALMRSRTTEAPSTSVDAVVQVLQNNMAPGALAEYLAEPSNGLFTSSKCSLKDLMEKHQAILMALLRMSPTYKVSTLVPAVEALNQEYGGRLGRGGIWEKEEAYGLKQMLMKVRYCADRCTTGERMPGWLQDLCDILTGNKCKVNCIAKLGPFAKRELKRQRSLEEPTMEKTRPMVSPLPTKEELVALYGGAIYKADSGSIPRVVVSSSDEEVLHVDAELEDDVVEVAEKVPVCNKVFFDHGRGCMVKAVSSGEVVVLGQPEVGPPLRKLVTKRPAGSLYRDEQPSCALGKLKLVKAQGQSYVQYLDAKQSWRLLVAVSAKKCARHQELATKLFVHASECSVEAAKLKSHLLSKRAEWLLDPNLLAE